MLLLIITPISFAFSKWLVTQFSTYARGSGIPQVSASLELCGPQKYYLVDKILSIRIILIKRISSIVMVFGGGLVGREGVTIQIYGSIFKKNKRLASIVVSKNF